MGYYQNPDTSRAHVVVMYRDGKEYGNGAGDYGGDGYGGGYRQHRGLYVNALMTARVLRKEGVACDVAPVADETSVAGFLKAHPGVTHVVFQAVWVAPDTMAELCAAYPSVHFVVRTHSQVGFLQVEPRAIDVLRAMLLLEQQQLNLTVSTNTERLQEFLVATYRSPVLYLPNLYDAERASRKRDESHRHRLFRVGSFGAHRLLKNHTTGAAAALMMAERRSSDLEFYVNANREEHGGEPGAIMRSLRAMFAGVPWAKLVEVPWAEWAAFRATVAHMDLCVQTSFTETFNIVTCDAACEGVPSVVGPAIEWAPRRWVADVDDAADVARVGSSLLCDPGAAQDGLRALERHQAEARRLWLDWVGGNPTL